MVVAQAAHEVDLLGEYHPILHYKYLRSAEIILDKFEPRENQKAFNVVESRMLLLNKSSCNIFS